MLLTLFTNMTGCGGGGSSSGGSTNGAAPMVVLTTVTSRSVNQGKTLVINAAVFPATNVGVNWTLNGPGFLTDQTFKSVIYHAPSSVSQTAYAVVTASSTVSSGSIAYVPITVLPQGIFPNQQPVVVNGGPVSGRVAPNRAFTSIKICTPGTLTCATVDGILVDTASSGLRILASAVPPLLAATDASGKTLSECFLRPDQSYVWGEVQLADVRISGEVAASLPVQAIGAAGAGPTPSDCSSNGAGADLSTLNALGANGILGVGIEPQDCGMACDPAAGGQPPASTYYTCSGGNCAPAFVPVASQVSHPAVFFDWDNNGVALQLAPLTGTRTAPGLTGSLTFGIETQPNNALANATLFTLDSHGHFTTELNSQSLEGTIDSTSAGNLFPDGNLPVCAEPNSSFYCPAALTSLTATNIGANNARSTINFSADNADLLFSASPNDAALAALAGPVGSACTGGTPCGFVWGLPFFYGRNVVWSIRGQIMPLLTPEAPWFAYDTSFPNH